MHPNLSLHSGPRVTRNEKRQVQTSQQRRRRRRQRWFVRRRFKGDAWTNANVARTSKTTTATEDDVIDDDVKDDDGDSDGSSEDDAWTRIKSHRRVKKINFSVFVSRRFKGSSALERDKKWNRKCGFLKCSMFRI